MSGIQPDKQTLSPYVEALTGPWQDYTTSVSDRAMALNIETCAYLWWLCEYLEAQYVADLGSGFSSYVLRRYAAEAGWPVTVASVDDNELWLTETADYLAGQGLSTTGLYSHMDWQQVGDDYDVILHDFSAGAVRERWMRFAAERVREGGVVVFDDAQHRSHHLTMCSVARECGLTLLDVYEQTVDVAGRHATAAIR